MRFSFWLDFPKYLAVTQFSFSLEVIPPSPLSAEMAAVGAGCPRPTQRGIRDRRASAAAHPAAPRSPYTPSHRQGHPPPSTLPYSCPPPSPGGSRSGKERETSFPRSLADPRVGLLRTTQRGPGAGLRFLSDHRLLLSGQSWCRSLGRGACLWGLSSRAGPRG